MIIVDTREQLPLYTRGVTRRKLYVGDYSTDLLEDVFCIERKSPSDLYGSITKGHVRFRNELIRAKANGIKLVLYVECSHDHFINKCWPGGDRRQMECETLKKIINTVTQRYCIETIWCSSRRSLMIKIKQRLKLEEKMYVKSQKINPSKPNAKRINGVEPRKRQH